MINFKTAHNDKKVWDRPDEFRPERFIDENGQFNRQHNFIQFGLGNLHNVTIIILQLLVS